MPEVLGIFICCWSNQGCKTFGNDNSDEEVRLCSEVDALLEREESDRTIREDI